MRTYLIRAVLAVAVMLAIMSFIVARIALRPLQRLGKAAASHNMYLVCSSDIAEPDGSYHLLHFTFGVVGYGAGQYSTSLAPPPADGIQAENALIGGLQEEVILGLGGRCARSFRLAAPEWP